MGFRGRTFTFDLGPGSDMVLFFICLNRFAPEKHPELDWTLLTDRLYRRYIRKNELDDATVLMEKLKNIFAEIPTSLLPKMTNETKLDFSQPNLAMLFERFFRAFLSVRERALISDENFEEYLPVRVMPLNTGYLIRERNRPLEELDALSDTDPPFWLRYLQPSAEETDPVYEAQKILTIKDIVEKSGGNITEENIHFKPYTP